MADGFVLCRRDVSDFDKPKKFCAKPIKTKNPLNWCDADLKRVPIWPTNTKEKK